VERYGQYWHNIGLFINLKAVLLLAVLVGRYTVPFRIAGTILRTFSDPKTAKMARALLNSGSFDAFHLIDLPLPGAWICAHSD